MQTIKTYWIALCLASFLPGCTNALYFYETEKISLTAEARPDSSQPVQGSLGIKQRVVLIAPKKDERDNAVDKNKDTVSAISSFSFKIIPEAGTPLNPILIQTTFITGDAARLLEPNEATSAAQAITLGGAEIATSNESAEKIISNLDSNDRNTLKEITKRDFDTLSDQDFENIDRITNFDRKLYTRELHDALRRKLPNWGVHMNKYNYKFVVINQMPTSRVLADNLSIQMTLDYGGDGWELIAVTAIPDTHPPGMLLTFQKNKSTVS